LEAQSANALGPGSGTTTVQSGGTLRLWNAGGVTYGSEALTQNGAGVGSGGALRNITNNNTWQGAITLGSASRINSDAGTLTIDVASGNAVSGTFDLTIGGNGNVTVNDNIGIGTAKLVKDGLGTLTLGAVNNYTGNTEIDAGTLSIGSGGGLSSSSMLFLGSGLNNSDATLLLAGTTTLANAIQVNTTNSAGSGGARFITKSDATSQTLSGNFTNNLQTSVNVANSAGNLALSGAMAGSGNIVKVGEGTLALSGSSGSFSGGLFIDQGTLNLAGGSTGASAIEIGGGSTVNSINASNATLRVSANSTFSQALTVNANTNASGQSGNRTIDFANSGGTATLSGALSVEKGFTVNVANSGATGILGGTITGGGGPQITVTGNGTLGLTDLNSTTSARWSVSSGSTLAIGNTRNLGTNPANYFSDKVTLNGGTLLATNSFSLNANVGIQLAASTTSAISVGSGLVMTNPAVMGGTGNLTKSGSGTLVLSGNNTYTGSTTVSQGELRMMGVLSSSSLLNVSAGATLSGTGTIGGATTISGIHSPGTSPGIQTFSSGLTYNAGSTNIWELTSNTSDPAQRGTSYDGVNLGSGANLTFVGTTKMSLVFNSAGSSVNWTSAFWNTNNSWLVYDLSGAGAITGATNFSVDSINWVDSQGNLFTQSRPDASFSISVSGQDLNLIYTIPEPSTYALLALSGIALGF
ncbi:MAG: beta strand repeat-containing protein, partial [Chthoniobacterales bacterium]